MLVEKLQRALRYKSSTFNLIKGDDGTRLTRGDLHYILDRMPMDESELLKENKLLKEKLSNIRRMAK